MRKQVVIVVMAGILASGAGGAFAQGWPSQPPSVEPGRTAVTLASGSSEEQCQRDGGWWQAQDRLCEITTPGK